MIDKQHIITELENRGETELAKEAESKLPQDVHLGTHDVQLRQLGLDPADLAAKFEKNQGG